MLMGSMDQYLSGDRTQMQGKRDSGRLKNCIPASSTPTGGSATTVAQRLSFLPSLVLPIFVIGLSHRR